MTDFDKILSVFAESPQLNIRREEPASVAIGSLVFYFDGQHLTRVMGKDNVLFTRPAPTPVHLLMRFSDKLGFIGDTIEAHSDVIEKRGAAWFGKMGKTLARDKVERVNDQCKRKVPTFLYLVQKSTAKGYQIYRGDILQVARDLPTGQTRFIPKYYETNRLEKYIRLWIKLTKLKAVPSSEITGFVVSSSGSPVLVTLGRSMAALFVVRKKMSVDDEPKPEPKEDNDSDWDF